MVSSRNFNNIVSFLPIEECDEEKKKQDKTKKHNNNDNNLGTPDKNSAEEDSDGDNMRLS